MKYGQPPKLIARVPVSLPEVVYYLYLPVSLAGSQNLVLPRNLEPIRELIEEVAGDLGRDAWIGNNIYVTAKKMFCSPSVTANRPGWHADGFGTSDLNYIWYDCLPTEFAIGKFNITEGDHLKSLSEFEEQAKFAESRFYPEKWLLKLDPSVVHRVTEANVQMMRTFVKISVSKDQYNLKDNSINHELNYDWKRYDRDMVRNCPSNAQKDSYTPKDDHFV